MIYGWQSVSELTNQPAGLLVGQALLVSFHAPWQSMQELSSLGRSAVCVLCARFYSQPTSPREIRRQRSSKEREKEGKEKARRWRRKDAKKSETRGRTGRAIRWELVARSSKKNWKSVAPDGGESRGETALEYRRARRIPPFRLYPVSSFLSSFSTTKRSRWLRVTT